MDRFQWFYKQTPTQVDMNSSDDKIEQADHDLVSDILGYGFLISATNPATVEEHTPNNLTVDVNQFLGYDQAGRRLSNVSHGYQGGLNLGPVSQIVNMAVDEVSASTAVLSPGNEKTLSIFVEFKRHETDPKIDGNSNSLYYDQAESIQFNVVQSAEAVSGSSVAPPLRTDQLLLCDIVIVYGQTTITDSDIDVSRRQAFVFNLTHGGSHIETGEDPIPNATSSAGGLMSSADKILYDSILSNKQARRVLIGSFTPTAAQNYQVVTSIMTGKSPGGTSAQEGVVTDSPNNLVTILDQNDDELVNGSGNKVFGRMTYAAGTWTLYTYTKSGGSESAYTHNDTDPLTIYATETFSVQNIPCFSNLPIPIDQYAPLAQSVPAVAYIPLGGIIMWKPDSTHGGSPPSLPDHDGFTFVYCNGVSVATGSMAGATTPNLMKVGGAGQQAFPRGADWSSGSFTYTTAHPTGGSSTHSHVYTHTHGISGSGLTADSGGSHTHTAFTGDSSGHLTSNPETNHGSGSYYTLGAAAGPGALCTHAIPVSVASGGGHSHSVSGSITTSSQSATSTDATSSLPPYCDVAFIMRTN